MALFLFLRRFASVVYLMTHPDVPLRLKVLPVIAVVYLFLPRDLIIDFRFPFGLIDDFIVVAVLLGIFTNRGWHHIDAAKKRKDGAIPAEFQVIEPDGDPAPDAPPDPNAPTEPDAQRDPEKPPTSDIRG